MKMNYIKILMLIIVSLAMIRCESQKSDFGFDSSISGVVKDDNGTPLYGDLTSNNLVVKLLGENDEQALEIRVKGDGTYQNIKMAPKKHEVWLEGPIVSSNHVTVDFEANPNQILDFIVTPLILPKISGGTGSGTSISVNYTIIPIDGNTVKKMEIYCSTVQYPTAATGSRTNVYFTKTVSLTQLSGSVTIDGLETGVDYHIRIGAQAESTSLMNYSNQIEVSL